MIFIEKEYSESEVIECSKLHNDIVLSHEECSGAGFVIKNNEVYDCDCEANFKYAKELLYSHIPQRFWFVDSDYKNLIHDDKSKKIFKSIQNLNIASCIIIGNPGNGKTALLSIIGKWCICNSKKVFYLTTEDFIELIRNREKEKSTAGIYWDRLFNSDIVLLDDITGYSKSDWITDQLVHFLKKLYDKGSELFLTSSFLIGELEKNKMLREDLIGFLKRIKDVMVVDYKGNKKLQIGNYFDGSFLKEAQKYFKEQIDV